MALGIAGLMSGGGTTLLRVYLATLDGPLCGLVELRLAVASRKGIGGIDKLVSAGFPVDQIIVCDPRNFGKDRQRF